MALKGLPAAFARDSERMARFSREAQVLASLNHPNIAGIHQIEEADRTHFLVMELVEGETIDVAQVRKLFDTNLHISSGRDWDVTADGQRFLLNSEPPQNRGSVLNLVINWPALLESN